MTHEEWVARRLTRRDLMRRAAGVGGAFAVAPLLAACGGDDEEPATGGGGGDDELKGTGKVVIGAFEDGALAAFKEKMVPLFKEQTGISIEILEDEYCTFSEKAFNDAQTGAG